MRFTDNYICQCGYVYSEERGCPSMGITAGTRFEDLPDDWVCPVCGLTKDYFGSRNEAIDAVK